MNITTEQLHTLLKEILNPSNLQDDFIQSLEYACLPAGKLFRPLIALAVLHDNGQAQIENAHIRICLSLEIHHSYTLVHDDLPSMDNDPVRRGKPSHHIKYSEWQAILAGDALLLKSIEVLSNSKHPLANKFIQIYSKLLGENGLIYGQYLDLSGKMKESFELLRKTHLLKTSRLMQASLLIGLTASKKNLDDLSFKNFALYYKIGQELGLCFQFIDDLLEMKEDLNEHESDISAWLHYPSESFEQLSTSLETLQRSMAKLHNSQALREVLKNYFEKMYNEISVNQSAIESRLFKLKNHRYQLKPVMRLLDSLRF